MTRKKLDIHQPVFEVIIDMAEGNPGAITVMRQLLADPMGLMSILDFDDMGMRGSQIWVAYKDHCKGDIAVLKQCLRDRDAKMVATVNAECPEHRAVTGGAS